VALRIGVDIGGTFTDLVALDETTGAVVTTKALSTPRELLEGVLSCVDQAGVRLADCRFVIHGTTIGINALLELKGARTGLITTEGFRDVLEIGRGNFLKMYDVLYRRPEPLVPRGRSREVPERLSATGEVLVPLDEEAVRAAARQLLAAGVESVAVVFLFSYRDPAHEQRAAQIVAAEMPGVSVSASHRITQEWREYERTSTTVVNAYVQPIMDRYLGEFGRDLGGRGFRGELLVTQSNGGAFSLEAARSKPVHTIESGPAAGVTGSASLSRILGADRLISFDMGGTTAKCAIVERGLVQTTDEYHVDGRPLRIPVIDIKEVSAGGGTIAWIDAGGALTLGPHSAGADPGPVCYGRGGRGACHRRDDRRAARPHARRGRRRHRQAGRREDGARGAKHHDRARSRSARLRPAELWRWGAAPRGGHRARARHPARRGAAVAVDLLGLGDAGDGSQTRSGPHGARPARASRRRLGGSTIRGDAA